MYDNNRLTPLSPVATTCTAGFKIHKPYILSVERISTFRTDLRTNKDYFRTQH
jgi:hypothetical protein